MAIQQNFPSTRPSLNLNFARSKTLDPRITFTRTSTGTYVDENGLVKIAPANSPRFDHDPVTGESLGLLVEDQRENLSNRSEDFMVGPWGVASATREQDFGISPDGNITADKIITTGGGVFRSFSGLTNSVNYTYSVFLKSVSGTGIVGEVGFNQFGSTLINGKSSFNLSTGTIVSQGSNVISSSIIKYPNDWYRVSVTVLSTDTTAVIVNYSAVSGNEFLIWGAQLEQGAFPTSYIPTTTSTATRTPDFASITGTNFSSGWFNPIEGTTIIQLRNLNISATSTSLLSYRGTIVPNNSMNYFRQLDAQPVGQIIFNGTLPMNIGLGAIWTTENLQKHAFFYKKDNSGIANSNLVSVDTSVDIPEVNSLIIGSTVQQNNKFIISQLTYYPVRLPNTIMQTLTK